MIGDRDPDPDARQRLDVKVSHNTVLEAEYTTLLNDKCNLHEG
jgi:hypothetical protein